MFKQLLHPLWLVLLLPLFFVLHGYRENYPLVATGDAALILIRYLLIALGFYALAWLLYKNSLKAALAAAAIMFLQFFFGSIHDALINTFATGILTKYSFIISFFALLLLTLLILLKRKKWEPVRFARYLQLLLFLLVVIDAIGLLSDASRINNQKLLKGDISVSACPTCEKPDIYFIIADAYPGQQVLDSFFRFNNHAFTQALTERGFHITERSSSNYNFTMFSVASMLNMNYLKGIRGDYRERNDIRRCFRAIRENHLLRYLTSEGYTFYNHSLFDFKNNPSPAEETFIPRARELITSQTFTRRIEKDLSFHVFSALAIESRGKKIMYRHDRNNKKLISLTSHASAQKTGSPKFVYTHLLMPHFPYYYDSNGMPYNWKTLLHYNHDKVRYLEYLQYSNGVFLSLIDSILTNSPKPPIIIFGSDHGFRQFTQKVTTDILCTNFNAVLLPKRNYRHFYKGMSSVNNFRVVLNAAFNQHLPMLKDSTIFIIDSEMRKTE